MEDEVKTETQDPVLTKVERLEKVALDLKHENDRMEELENKRRESAALDALGGKTETAAKEEPKEQSPEDYAKEVLEGKHGEQKRE